MRVTARSVAAGGVLLVIAGALLLSAKGIFAKLLYARGVDWQTVTTVRMLLALPLFWIFALWRLGPQPLLQTLRPRLLLLSVAAGFLCYYAGALANFYALTLIDASLERVLLFTYPALVVLARVVSTHKLGEPGVLVALVLTWVGTILVVGGLDFALLRQNAEGALMVLLCAATLAVYFLINERVGRDVSSTSFTTWAMTAAVVGLTAHFAISPGWGTASIPGEAWPWLIAMVVVATVAPMFMIAEGVRRIGAERAALVSTVGPPSTIILAWLILDERLSVAQLLGAGLIVITIAWLERPGIRSQPLPLPDEAAGPAPPRQRRQ